ncbi:MAG: homoserine O-succinyltransferase [Spirochaetaceae bacterium]|nr:homoserine O-succinyltransferase [Spirochaetaceae bacterium]MCF7948409.1 homoserine O-succinyltransferase [Spirochaetia bacterium]MCF7950858.1 homoserine O-succinyltransferase [Spirochaetaceae bacterium]
MPINIPTTLPAKAALERENIFVMPQDRAQHQDIRPLKIAVVNLMPTKMATETQLLRLLSNSPLQVDVELVHPISHESKNTDPDHLQRFYTSLEHIRAERYDGMIITGAPVETIPFEDVDYWQELAAIMDYSRRNVYSTLHICWGAQAGLYHHYGIPKYPLGEKLFGVFQHQRYDNNMPLFRGFEDSFPVPHSRYTEVKAEDIIARPQLELLAASEEAGVCAVSAHQGRQIFITGHLEYDTDTLAAEYRRDVAKGLDIAVPRHYFPGDDPQAKPTATWRAHAHLLFTNWLNYYVYQATPYNLDELEEIKTHLKEESDE